MVPTLSSGICCSKKKQALKSHLAEFQPNYSYPGTGIPIARGSREGKQASSHITWIVVALCMGQAKSPFLCLIAKTNHEFVVNIKANPTKHL